MNKNYQLDSLIKDFPPINLHGLNNRAALLERYDSKYVLTTKQLLAFLAAIINDFDILEINNKRQFTYETIYFDSANYQCYLNHNQGKRKRIKVCLRNYKDSNLQFFEIKHKAKRSLTIKERIPISHELININQLTPGLMQILNQTLIHNYGWPWQHDLSRSLVVFYERITMVAKYGAERITIDNNINYLKDNKQLGLNPDRWVIEVKSKTGISDIDRILFAQGVRPTQGCSKYCMGVSTLVNPKRNDSFKPILKRYFGLQNTLRPIQDI